MRPWSLGRLLLIHYEVDAHEVIDWSRSQVHYQERLLRQHGWDNLHSNRRNEPKLSEDEIHELATLGLEIASRYGVPQDIEWARVDEQFYILQARPITTQGGQVKGGNLNGQVLVKGSAACFGVVTGVARKIDSPHQLDQVQQGDILVTRMTTPDFIPVFSKLAGIVTDQGGATCHAAIISREYNLPCVVGTKIATYQIKSGDVITVDGGNGMVYKGVAK